MKIEDLKGCFANVNDDNLLRENGLLSAENKELKQEIERLNNIINELEEELEYRISYGEDEETETYRLMTLEDKIILEKLRELKGDGSNECKRDV